MNYPYANGRIAAIEEKILNRNVLSKLPKEPKEILKSLIELGYGEPTAADLETLISLEMKKVKQLILEISPELRHSDLFFIASDTLNIKTLYKMKIFGLNQEAILVDSGVIPLENLKRAILSDDFTNLDKALVTLLKDINDQIKEEQNPRLISAKIDNLVFQYLFARLKKKPSVILETYYQTFVDLANVKTFIRSHNLNWSNQEFLEMFIFGGKIPQEVLVNLYTAKTEDILKTLETYYNGEITKGLKKYYETHDLNSLEQYLDQLMLNIMKEFRFDSFSIGPMIYYYLKKQAEAKNIRYIYANQDVNASMLLDY